jgi:hypothetical protein
MKVNLVLFITLSIDDRYTFSAVARNAVGDTSSLAVVVTVAPRGVVARLRSNGASASQDTDITLSADGSADLDGRGLAEGLTLAFSCQVGGTSCTTATTGLLLELAPLTRGTRCVSSCAMSETPGTLKDVVDLRWLPSPPSLSLKGSIQRLSCKQGTERK